MPKKLLMTVVVLAGLAGCNAGTPNVSQRAAEGAGVTGAIQHGRVTLSVIGERSIEQIAEARTDADGSFTMSLSRDIHQPMLLEVKPAQDGRSRMVCDSDGGCGDFARGDAMPVPESFRMLALVAPGESNGRELTVNPYTHIATHEAVRIDGLINSGSIAHARERTARGYRIDNRFWQRSARQNRADRLHGVARASVASASHRLVIQGGVLDVRAEVSASSTGCGQVDCGPARLAQNLVGEYAEQRPETRLF